MSDLPQKTSDFLDLIRLMPERQERIEFLMSMADKWRPVPESIAPRPYPDLNKVPQCESEAYMFAEELPDRTLRYHFAVENPQGISAMAMASIIDETLSGEPLEDVLKVPADVIYDIFGRELSMGKGLGLMGMMQMVHGAARRHLKKREEAGQRI